MPRDFGILRPMQKWIVLLLLPLQLLSHPAHARWDQEAVDLLTARDFDKLERFLTDALKDNTKTFAGTENVGGIIYGLFGEMAHTSDPSLLPKIANLAKLAVRLKANPMEVVICSNSCVKFAEPDPRLECLISAALFASNLQFYMLPLDRSETVFRLNV